MPSIITHPAVPLAIGFGLGPRIVSRRLLFAGVVASIVPDLDVYAEMFTSSIGHRGITHSLLFALLCGVFAAAVAPVLETRRAIALAFIFVATASHGILDAFTTGGPAVSFLWPWRVEGYFMPYRVIEVSPLGIARFFSERGLSVLASELRWVWTPALAVGAALYVLRR
jgi:inner membrane protein